jgi:hypothetical protein
MMLGGLPVIDERRQRLRDDKLWSREVRRARLLNLKQIHCPCSVCKGRKRYLLAKVREHLIQNGRDDNFRVWRGPGSRDTSDDDWEDNFWGPAIERTREVDVQVDTRRMVQETFQGGNDSVTLEERVQEVASNAFAQADALHNDSIENHFNDAANV